MEGSTAYLRHTYSGFEPMQAFDIVYGGHFGHRLLAAGNATMEHQRLVLGDVRLEAGSYDFAVIAQGSMPRDGICIGFVLDGSETTRYNTTDIAADDVQFYPGGAELLYHASRASRWINFTVEESRLQQSALSRTGRPLPLDGKSARTLTLARGSRSHLGQLVIDAMSLGRSLAQAGGIGQTLASAMAESLLASYIDVMHDATLSSSPMRAAAERHHHLICACERLVTSGSDAYIALSEIAQRSGYSLRALQLIFRRSVGMTPGRWFLNIRLNGALRDLVGADAA